MDWARVVRRWVIPFVVFVVLAAVGFSTFRSLSNLARKNLDTKVRTILGAEVEALHAWLKSHKATADTFVQRDDVRQAVEQLIEDYEAGALPEQIDKSDEAIAIERLVKPVGEAHNYPAYAILDRQLVVLATNSPRIAAGDQVASVAPDLQKKLMAGEPVVSRPFILKSDKTGGFTKEEIAMFAAASIKDESKQIIAFVGFAIRPDREFTDILRVARAGDSGETYAFDEQAWLLSESRFRADLRRIGFLAEDEDATAVLNIKIHDPGVNLKEGEKTDVPPDDWEQTVMVKRTMAIRERAGDTWKPDLIETELEPYRDYRGVEVIGAYTWLPEYGFGVTTEIDYEEAFAPKLLLMQTFGMLFTLAAVGAVAVIIYTRTVARLQGRVRSQEKQIERLGQYTLTRQIGAGGMGEVHLAEHAMLRRPTAVKLLPPERISDLAVARFEREVQLTAELAHPNTIEIYDYGRTSEGIFYYAMEYLEGFDLDQVVKRTGSLPPARVIHLLRQICGSLGEAHDRGLIHRDIKPANIFLCHRGGIADMVKVLDFGLVKDVGTPKDKELSIAGSIAGTPLFMSPESVDAPSKVDGRSDLYAVGAVGYYLLTGQYVFEASTPMQVLHYHINATPTPPSRRANLDIPSDLEEVILKCLRKKPEDRPKRASEIIELLDACADAWTWTQEQATAWWQDSSESFEPVEPSDTTQHSAAPNEATLMVDYESRG